MKLTARGVIGVGLALFVAAACVRLGVWQIHRLQERRAANAARAARAALPPIRLDARAAARVPAEAESLAFRAIVARGRYDNARHVLVRDRTLERVPGVEIVTPLVLPDGAAVLVDRGFVPAPDGESVDPRAYEVSGEVEVRGVAEVLASSGRAPRVVRRGPVLVTNRLDARAVLGRFPYAVLPVVLREAPSRRAPAWPRRTVARPPDDGPHLWYAIQWFAFAAVILAGTAVLARSRRRAFAPRLVPPRIDTPSSAHPYSAPGPAASRRGAGVFPDEDPPHS